MTNEIIFKNEIADEIISNLINEDLNYEIILDEQNTGVIEIIINDELKVNYNGKIVLVRIKGEDDLYKFPIQFNKVKALMGNLKSNFIK
jgi:hypothetical protein